MLKKEGIGEVTKSSSNKNSQRPDFVKWFSELNKDSGKVAGGKGANLAEIYNLKIPVPPGFVVTAQAYDYFIEKAGLKEKIKELLQTIEYENTTKLGEATTQIRQLIEKAEMPEEMQEEILEEYSVLGTDDREMKGRPAHHILRSSSNEVFVAVRSSATTEDLESASFAGQQETFLNIKGKDSLIQSIKRCFSSLFTPRATYYRNKKGFKHEEASLAVVVQKMIDSDRSGVIFSKDPSTNKEEVVIEAVWGLGEGIVSGKITPDRYRISPENKIIEREIGHKKIAITRNSAGNQEIVKLKEERAKQQVLKDNEVIRLKEYALKLEDHYKKPQDIEFAIENNEIYIVQTRPITTLKNQVTSAGKELKGEVILSGLAASPGIGVGKIKIVRDLSDLNKVVQGDVLVTEMTNPDMVVTMQKSAAIVTDEGGLTAHAAIVSREMGIPAIVGTGDATTKLKEGEIITVDGFTGKVYKGKVAESVQKEVIKVEKSTKTEIKVILDLPSFAERAAKSGLKGVGLARLEGIIAESGKHPKYFLDQKKMQEYEEMIFKGIEKISEYFENIWVRTSDIRSDEFQNLEGAPKEKEANPMLGMHGIRFSLRNPEILKAELNAMKRVAEKGTTIGVMFPQVISPEEVRKVKEHIKEIGFTKAKIGVMIETPASVQLIREIAEEKIDFISFGTNDLTQYILAVDRGNTEVQDIYNELNPAVLYQLEFVLRVCSRNKIETSICGQAGSKREMVKFLVERGIDSISVNADLAADIAEYIYELEKQGQPEIIVHENTPKFTMPKDQEKEKVTPKEEDISEETLPKIPGTEALKEPEEEVKNTEEETKQENSEQTLDIF